MCDKSEKSKDEAVYHTARNVAIYRLMHRVHRIANRNIASTHIPTKIRVQKCTLLI